MRKTEPLKTIEVARHEEFVSDVADATGESKKVVRSVLNAYADAISRAMYHYGGASVKGVGKLVVRARRGGRRFNVRTRGLSEYAAKNVVHFTPYKPLKEAAKKRPLTL